MSISTNTTAKDKSTTSDLSAETVQGYLRENPSVLYGFLEAEPAVLAAIQLPKSQHIDAVSSLAQKQAEVLRSRKVNSDTKLVEFVETAKENDLLFEQTRNFVLAIMRCKSKNSLLKTVREQFQQEFAVEYTCAEITSKDAANGKLRFLEDSGKNNVFKGVVRSEESNVLFGNDNAQSAVALSRTLNNGEVFFIAVGNSQPNFYSQNIGMRFITFLSDSSLEMLNILT